MRHQNPNSTFSVKPRLITIREAAVYTGLAVDTLYKMVNQRRIPFVKAGRLVKFDIGMLDDWIQQNTIMPMPTKRSGH